MLHRHQKFHFQTKRVRGRSMVQEGERVAKGSARAHRPIPFHKNSKNYSKIFQNFSKSNDENEKIVILTDIRTER